VLSGHSEVDTGRVRHLLTPDALFLATLQDLERRQQSEEPYDILGMAGLLRKLLLDAEPLIDQVNRTRRLKIRFRIVPGRRSLDALRASGPTYYDIGDCLDPSFVDITPQEAVDLTRDQFLSTLVNYVLGQAITVRDIITFEANVAGGVHAPSSPREPAHMGLDVARQQIIMKGQSVSLYHLRNIGRVVARALQPLKSTVEGSERAG